MPSSISKSARVSHGGAYIAVDTESRRGQNPFSPHQTLTGAASLPAVPVEGFLSVSFSYRLLQNRTVGYLRRSIEERLVMGGLVFSGPAGSGKSALLKVRKGKEQRGGGNACSRLYFVTRYLRR